MSDAVSGMPVLCESKLREGPVQGRDVKTQRRTRAESLANGARWLIYRRRITPTLPPSAQLTLVILMYVGRVGTIAVGTAIALNTRRRLYRYPEERPLVG